MSVVIDHFSEFLDGYLRSLLICGWSLLGSLALGTLLAAMRISPLAPLRLAAATYVQCLMNTPLAVVLFFVAFGIPELGFNASYFVFGITGLVLYTAAFVCESVRAGVNGVSVGETEAARSIGMRTGQVLAIVVIPQAIRTSIPPLANTIISMFTNSAVVGAFGVGGDLFAVSTDLTSAQGYPNLPVLTGMGIGYLCITIPIAFGLRVLERKVAVQR